MSYDVLMKSTNTNSFNRSDCAAVHATCRVTVYLSFYSRNTGNLQLLLQHEKCLRWFNPQHTWTIHPKGLLVEFHSQVLHTNAAAGS